MINVTEVIAIYPSILVISFIVNLNWVLNIISYLLLLRSLLNYESKKELGKAEKRNVL